jgi:hypothetical protein
MFDGLIFYSSFIPNTNNLFRGKDFLEIVKKKFNNHLVFIGIQKDSIPEWENILENYKKENNNIFYDYCDEKLYVNSDVAGFQKALQLYYLSKNKFNIKDNSLVWFGHTKGSTTNLNKYHYWVFENFWGKKNEIEEKLYSEKKYGCYGTHLSFIPDYSKKGNIKNLWVNNCNYKFTHEPLNFMFVNTFFIVKNMLFQNMLNHLNPIFFEEKIEGAYTDVGDRYYFERDFIHFVDMMGFQPLFEYYSPNVVWNVTNEFDFKNNLNEWVKTV